MARWRCVSLVLTVMILTGLGLDQSARGLGSLTLDLQPLLVVRTGGDVITVQTMGQSYTMNRQGIQSVQPDGRETGKLLQQQGWKAAMQMGRALARYIRLVF